MTDTQELVREEIRRMIKEGLTIEVVTPTVHDKCIIIRAKFEEELLSEEIIYDSDIRYMVF